MISEIYVDLTDWKTITKDRNRKGKNTLELRGERYGKI